MKLPAILDLDSAFRLCIEAVEVLRQSNHLGMQHGSEYL